MDPNKARMMRIEHQQNRAKFYDDSQPRGEDGKWGDGGNGDDDDSRLVGGGSTQEARNYADSQYPQSHMMHDRLERGFNKGMAHKGTPADKDYTQRATEAATEYALGKAGSGLSKQEQTKVANAYLAGVGVRPSASTMPNKW